MTRLTLVSALLLCFNVCAQTNLANTDKLESTQTLNALGPDRANVYRNQGASSRFRLDENNVVEEADGSFTPLTESVVDVLAILTSSIGAAANFELTFAENSYVLTADGQQTLGLIASSIKYLDPDTRIDLDIPEQPGISRELTTQRAKEIVRLLSSRYGLKQSIELFVSPVDAYDGIQLNKQGRKRTQIQLVTVLNMGIQG